MVVRAVPAESAELTQTHAHGLNETYRRLRESVRDLAESLGIGSDEFDRELPSIEPPRLTPAANPRASFELANDANTAAGLLRQLAGYVEGLIEMVVLEQQITTEQVRAAGEASREPTGFR
jgi:hypothetical protein